VLPWHYYSDKFSRGINTSVPAVEYIKHLVECNCVLPQFKHVEPPRWHHFVVFSEINEKGDVIPSFVQCNNCGIIHKVIEVQVSSILRRDDLPSLSKIEDLKSGLPVKLAGILEQYHCDLPTYQETMFILEHKLWGKTVILSRDEVDGFLVGKYLQIFGETLWKVASFQEEIEE
jgi:hypothetical protein